LQAQRLAKSLEGFVAVGNSFMFSNIITTNIQKALKTAEARTKHIHVFGYIYIYILSIDYIYIIDR